MQCQNVYHMTFPTNNGLVFPYIVINFKPFSVNLVMCIYLPYFYLIMA